MNRYRATAVAVGLLLTLGACGGSDKPVVASNQTPIVPSTPVTAPTAIPKPTPLDPTTAARKQVLAAYAVFYATFTKGLQYGGATYRYDGVMVGPALTAARDNQTVLKGIRRVKITGRSLLLESRVSDIDLTAKPATATVTACVVDGLRGVDKNGKVIEPGGKISRRDLLKVVKGRWMVYSTQTGDKSYGCTK
ncbi:hypothetical protein ACQPYH_06310 [Kribbella sp. CA-245084]|uniref:hypothetical protein n=1 Tax=Kribbella sp. CA-245084 TaxID=3239940 RepID=UPI003D945907